MHCFLRWPTLLIFLPFSASGDVDLSCYHTGGISLNGRCAKIEVANPWSCATLPESGLVVRNIAHYQEPSPKLSFFERPSDISVGLLNSNFDLSIGEITFPHPTLTYLFPRSSCPLGLVVNRIVFAREVEMGGAATWLDEQPTLISRQGDCLEREVNLENSPWSPKQVDTQVDFGFGDTPPAHGTTIVHFVRDDPVHGTDVTTISYLGDQLIGLRLTQCETDWGVENNQP